MIPSEPVYGVADVKDHTKAPYAAPVNSYTEPSVQRSSLTPVASAGPAAQGPYVGGSFAMQPIDAPQGAKSPSDAGKRYAGSAPSYYERAPKDYRAGPDSYAARSRSYDDKPRGDYGRAGQGQGSDYVVAVGDTMYSIAQRHGMTTTELAELNGLNGSTIHPGQRLRVRGPEYTGANRYKAPPAYESAYREPAREPRAAEYGDNDRKAPPAYSEDRGGRYGSYSGYAGSKPQPNYNRDEEDAGDDPAGGSDQPRADAGRPPYAETRYDAERPYSRPDAPYTGTPPRSVDPYYAEKAPRPAQSPYYAEKPSRAEPAPYAERQSRGEGSSYPEKRYDAKRAPYADRQAYAGNPADDEDERGNDQDRYGRPDQRPGARTDEPRSEQRRGKSKVSYTNYSAKPGDTLTDIARRNGLSDRELAELNDIPQGGRLYPGQVLRLPKSRGYGWGERHEESENQDDRSSDRRGRPGYDDRTSQKAPAAGERGLNERERRLAKAQAAPAPAPAAPAAAPVAQESREPRHDDVAVTGPQGDRPASAPSEPIMAAANRDMGPAQSAPAAAQDCESMLPASRSAQTFREPVQGMVVAKFGSKSDGTFNDGIDFSVPKGTPVKVAENGVVAYAGNELPGFGNLVLVRHADGFVTAYAHNDELLVKRCEVVKRGQIISKAGASGKTTQPQLHFELRKDSKPVDPEAFFARS